MDYPVSSKEKGFAHWGSTRAQMEVLTPLDGGMRNLSSEDPFSIAELMNFDTYCGWCNSPAETDRMFASFGLLSYHQSMPQISVDSLNITQQNSGAFTGGSGASSGMVSPYNCGDRMVFQQTVTEFGSLPDAGDANDSGVTQNIDDDYQQSSITRPLGQSLDEKMLRALSFFKAFYFSSPSLLSQVLHRVQL